MEQFSQAVAQARWQHLVQQCFSIKTDDKSEPVKGKAFAAACGSLVKVGFIILNLPQE